MLLSRWIAATALPISPDLPRRLGADQGQRFTTELPRDATGAGRTAHHDVAESPIPGLLWAAPTDGTSGARTDGATWESLTGRSPAFRRARG